ncbi:hypothetical protein [Bremerella sp.]|uniref:hypothetical protein n=1 Tax=Bremerella sp. TaxID=2795602 RepID=UPI00391C4C74
MSQRANQHRLLNTYLSERQRKFQMPCFEYFRRSIGFDVPLLVEQLYSATDAIQATGVHYETASGGIWIQHFNPLDHDLIDLSVRLYHRRFLRFSEEGEGQSYLVNLPEAKEVWIDYDSDSLVLEKLDISFQDLAKKVNGTA